MPAAYPEAFERELACTEAEWLRWLPPAIGARDWELGDGTATVGLGDAARLHLVWQARAPRAIALLRLPRLQVAFRFEGAAPHERAAFMERFDLYLQRGGG
jgi:hypothetical protein